MNEGLLRKGKRMAFVRHGTLTANVVTTVSIGSPVGNVEILNRNGLGEIFASVGIATSAAGVPDPTVAGNDFEILPAVVSSYSINVQNPGGYDPGETTFVKLISSAAATYSVRA